jgi:hypothetical protein
VTGVGTSIRVGERGCRKRRSDIKSRASGKANFPG